MRRTHNDDPNKTAILNLIEAWGKRTIYRYLRDHNMLDDFIEQLPLKNYKDTDETTIQRKLISIWDDFSKDKLQAMRTWQKRAVEAGLGIRLALYAADLRKEGHHSAAVEILKLAVQVDAIEDIQKVEKTAGNLVVGDMLHSVNGRVGFGNIGFTGQVTAVSRVNDEIHVQAYSRQSGGEYAFKVGPGDPVVVLKTQRPRFANALKISAIAKLVAAEAKTRDIGLQAKIARARLTLEQELES